MYKSRSIKIVIACLIVLAVAILPMAFSVSYAKWTGGVPSVDASVDVYIPGSQGSETELSHTGANSLVSNASAGSIYTYVYDWQPDTGGSYSFAVANVNSYGNVELDFTANSSGSGRGIYIAITQTVRLQIFVDDAAVTSTGSKGTSTNLPTGVTHEENSLWFEFSCTGSNVAFYQIGYDVDKDKGSKLLYVYSDNSPALLEAWSNRNK